jgi:hypothetical protein
MFDNYDELIVAFRMDQVKVRNVPEMADRGMWLSLNSIYFKLY